MPSNNTVIRYCDCANAFQDSRYGRGMRVHTIGGTKISPKYTCTVCGKSAGSSVAKKSATNK